MGRPKGGAGKHAYLGNLDQVFFRAAGVWAHFAYKELARKKKHYYFHLYYIYNIYIYIYIVIYMFKI